MNHHSTHVQHLDKNIVREIAKTYTLTKCPICCQKLSEERKLSCGSTVRCFHSLNIQRMFCLQCNIEWRLKVSNASYQRHAYTTYHHFLKLSGNFFCGCSVDVLSPSYFYCFGSLTSSSKEGRVGGNASIGNPPSDEIKNKMSVTHP